MIHDVHEKLRPGLPRTKEAFGNKKNLFTNKLNLKSGKN